MKIYQKYREKETLGVITSGLVLSVGEDCVSNALTNLLKWNVKQGSFKVKVEGDKLITALAKYKNQLAIGYGDGSIKLIGKQEVVLNGHKSAVTALCFDKNGTRLASGSSDTDIVLWDIVSEEGIFRFKGHKDQVTCISFLEENVNHLISGSKDSVIKVWDIDAKCVVENIVLHRGEVWALAVYGSLLLSGASDGQLRVWNIDYSVLNQKFAGIGQESETTEIKKAISLLGVITRQNNEKIHGIKFHENGVYIGVQGTEKVLEVFKIKTEAEIAKAIKRRNKRALKNGGEASTEITLGDKIGQFNIIRTRAKIKSFDFVDDVKNNNLRVIMGLGNNSIETFELDLEDSKAAPRQVSCIELHGHRSDVRSVALNEDDQYIASSSNESLKIYSTVTGNCLQTMETGYALCSAFLPGSKHVVVGTKTGELQLFELASSTMIDSIAAHDGPIWSLQINPDKSGLVTGSQDRQVKFWKFSMILDEEYSKINKRVTLVHTKTLKLSDDVLSIRLSPDGKLIAVSLLDLTVKIFYVDSLKFFLSLYGHKLPVIAMDISFDSKIIITASSDKTVKIWGLDFGDCHRSLLAHTDAVMACRFVWGTYYFFTASKDRSIKYFDGEKFEEISKLEGHQGEVWALDVGKYGNIVVTGSHDKSTRIWEKTDEQFVLSEKREAEMEKLYESMDLEDDKYQQPIGSMVEGAENDQNHEDYNESATRPTIDSMKSGELLAEALSVWKQEQQAFKKYEEMKIKNPDAASPTRNPFTIQMQCSDLPPEECVLKVVHQIRSSHLNEALLTLPFTQVISLIECISEWIIRDLDAIQSSKILGFLLKTHHNEIVANRSLRPYLELIRKTNKQSLKVTKDKIGVNLYGLQALLRQKESMDNCYFPSADEPEEIEGKGVKRKIAKSSTFPQKNTCLPMFAKNIIRSVKLVRNFTVTPLYTAKATAVGGGRNGTVKSSDGLLDFGLSVPKGMGGPGVTGKTNPEQLFAAGYSSCFLGAVHAVSKVKVPQNTSVDASVHIGKGEGGKGFLLAVDLKLTMPGIPKPQVEKVLQDAHQLCPYSCATRGNIKVNLVVG